MDALLLAIAGLCGGLVGVIWNGVVTQPWLARRRPAAAGEGGLRGTLGEQAAIVLAYGFSGATLGLLYWLGWGLAAVNGWSWRGYGLAFGLLAWAALPLPVLLLGAVRSGANARGALPFLLEWLVACVGAGLFCALAWQRLG